MGAQADGAGVGLGANNMPPDAATQNLKNILGIGLGMPPQGIPIPLDAIFGPSMGHSGPSQFSGDDGTTVEEPPKLQQSDFPSLGDGLGK